MVYERLLADRNTSCLLLFPGPEESALCEQTRDCLDYFSRQLDFSTFTRLCDVIQAAGGEADPRPAGEDKRPGPAEVRPYNHRSSSVFRKMLRKFQCCGSGINFVPSRIRIKTFKYFNPKKWFLSSRKYYPGCSSRIRFPDPNLTFYPSWIPDQGVKKAPDPGSGSATLESSACR